MAAHFVDVEAGRLLKTHPAVWALMGTSARKVAREMVTQTGSMCKKKKKKKKKGLYIVKVHK